MRKSEWVWVMVAVAVFLAIVGGLVWAVHVDAVALADKCRGLISSGANAHLTAARCFVEVNGTWVVVAQ